MDDQTSAAGAETKPEASKAATSGAVPVVEEPKGSTNGTADDERLDPRIEQLQNAGFVLQGFAWRPQQQIALVA